MKKYCPACATTVEYEGTDKLHCSVCGRTESAALAALTSKRLEVKRKKFGEKSQIFYALLLSLSMT